MPTALKLDELAHRAGVSPRTIRYYIQRGLLPAPDFRGPDTAYGEHHLLALRAIRKLQDAFWPLEAIAGALHGKDEPALRRIAEGHLPTAAHEHTATAGEPPPPHEAPAPKLREHRAVRIELAPGLSLLLDDDAPPESHALVDQVRSLITSSSRNRKGGSSS